MADVTKRFRTRRRTLLLRLTHLGPQCRQQHISVECAITPAHDATMVLPLGTLLIQSTAACL